MWKSCKFAKVRSWSGHQTCIIHRWIQSRWTRRYLQTFPEIRFFCWQLSPVTFPPAKLTSHLKLRKCRPCEKGILCFETSRNIKKKWKNIPNHMTIVNVYGQKDIFVGEFIWVAVTQAPAAWQTSNTRAPRVVQIRTYQSWICRSHTLQKKNVWHIYSAHIHIPTAPFRPCPWLTAIHQIHL